MSERQLTRLFLAVERDEVDALCGPQCISTEEIVALAVSSTPANPEQLARVAACGACSAALRARIELNEADSAFQAPAVRRVAAGRRRFLWRAAALAVAAAVLVIVALQFTGPRDRAPHHSWASHRIEQGAVVLFVEGTVCRGAAALSAGDALPAGAEIRMPPGARIALLDSSRGLLRVVPDGVAGSIRLESPAFARLAGGLGPQQAARRRLVAALSDGVPRDRRPDFLALEPRGGIRSDRPVFKFRADLIGPDEDMILRVLDEDGIVHLEQRFQGAQTVRFPRERAPLQRGRRYVWSVSHPRSGSGPLGGEPFKVIRADSLDVLERKEHALGRLREECPDWTTGLLKAVLLRDAGLEMEALEALPDRAPDPRVSEFLLEERALILDELGLSERIGPLKKRLGLKKL